MKIDMIAESIKAVQKCLETIPFLSIQEINLEKPFGNFKPDMTLKVKVDDDIKYFIIEVKSTGEPRYAREAVNQLDACLESMPDLYGIFVSPYISPRAAEICKQGGVGYIDLAGNCYISFETIFIRNEGNPNPFTRNKYLRSMYSPKAERILRVLLANGMRKWKTEELAEEAKVSLGQVSNVKKLLEEQEWIKAKSVGFSLIDPISLLKDWAENYNFRRNLINNYYSLQSIAETEYRIAEYCDTNDVLYCLTGFSGSARYAPSVRYQRAMIYIMNNVDILAPALELKSVETGFNVTILYPYDEGVFYGSKIIDGSMIVSPIQNYLDLINIKGRGEEAAQMLFEEVITTLW